MARMKKSERIHHLAERFEEGAQLTLGRIMSDYGIDRRTANRDLNTLEGMGLQLNAARADDGQKIWSIQMPDRKIQVEYRIQDLMALFLGRKLFTFCEGTVLQDSIDMIYEKIELRLRREEDRLKADRFGQKMYFVSEGPKQLPKSSREPLDDVLAALLHETKVKLTYHNHKEEKKRILLHPYTLVVHRNGLYVVGYVEQWETLSILAFERMKRIERQPTERFEIPADYNVDKYFEKRLFIAHGEPEEVVLKLPLSARPFIGIRRYHRTQKLVEQDGALYMTLKVPLSFELENWILGFGINIEVISPPSFRARIAELLKEALAIYN